MMLPAQFVDAMNACLNEFADAVVMNDDSAAEQFAMIILLSCDKLMRESHEVGRLEGMKEGLTTWQQN